jgi:hypothetical protein
MKRSPASLLLSCALFLTILNSCKKSEDISTDVSFVSIYNATTNVPSLNFLINAEAVGASNLAIGQKSVYYGVYAGVWTTEAIPGSGTSTFKKDLTFVAGEHNSLFVIGSADSLDYFTIADDINAKDPNRAKIKFLNLSAYPGALTLEIQLLNNVTTFPNQAYKGFTDYQSLNAGTIYTLTLKDAATNSTIGTPITSGFSQGKMYTIWAKGTPNATIETQRLGLQISEVN